MMVEHLRYFVQWREFPNFFRIGHIDDNVGIAWTGNDGKFDIEGEDFRGNAGIQRIGQNRGRVVSFETEQFGIGDSAGKPVDIDKTSSAGDGDGSTIMVP
jgi:hypothetical protein